MDIHRRVCKAQGACYRWRCFRPFFRNTQGDFRRESCRDASAQWSPQFSVPGALSRGQPNPESRHVHARECPKCFSRRPTITASRTFHDRLPPNSLRRLVCISTSPSHELGVLAYPSNTSLPPSPFPPNIKLDDRSTAPPVLRIVAPPLQDLVVGSTHSRSGSILAAPPPLPRIPRPSNSSDAARLSRGDSEESGPHSCLA